MYRPRGPSVEFEEYLCIQSIVFFYSAADTGISFFLILLQPIWSVVCFLVEKLLCSELKQLNWFSVFLICWIIIL